MRWRSNARSVNDLIAEVAAIIPIESAVITTITTIALPVSEIMQIA